MNKTLIVCDNEFLKTLYALNFEVYLASSVVLADDAETAIALHKAKKDINLIVTLDMVAKKDAFKEIESYRGSYGVKTPVIKIGGESDQDVDAKTFIVSSRYNIQGILKKSASVLGVTAKQMAEMQVGAYYPISLVPIESLTKAPCNIYIEIDKKYKMLAKAQDALEGSLKDIRNSGIEQIFVKSSDRLTIVNSVSLSLIERISNALKNSQGATTEQKVQMLSDGYEFVAASLFSSEEVKQEVVEIANAAAKVMTEVVKDNDSMKKLLATMLSNKSGYVYTHSLICSYVAQHIIKNVTWGGDGQTEKINFVLFFHDIYLSPIYLKHPELEKERDIVNNPNLSDKEKEIVMNHAKLAAELVVGYKRCPMGADVLIKQHHGMKKGSGFAYRYPEDLSPLSKVFLIAEAFVEEFLSLTKEKKPIEMKVIIPKLIGEFGTPSYIKIIQTLVNLPI